MSDSSSAVLRDASNSLTSALTSAEANIRAIPRCRLSSFAQNGNQVTSHPDGFDLHIERYTDQTKSTDDVLETQDSRRMRWSNHRISQRPVHGISWRRFACSRSCRGSATILATRLPRRNAGPCIRQVPVQQGSSGIFVAPGSLSTAIDRQDEAETLLSPVIG